MVVGIFSDCAALKPIIDGLKASGADLDRLRALSCDEIPTELASFGVNYTWIGDVDRGLSAGDLGTGGTGMPTSTTRSVADVGGDEMLESLSELGIPDGRTDDFARAVEDGKLVVGYPAYADSAPLRQLFQSVGADSIHEF